MTDTDHDDDRFARVAESFVERYQKVERPSVERYADEHPEFAEQIRELFPALEVLEELAPGSEGLSRHGPTTDLDVPETIGGYRIVREIGRGGMGIVYEAEQPGLHRRVALKVLPSHVRQDEAALERFRRESQAAAGLQHPNIVPVYEVGEDELHAFYVMQFVDGQGLDAVLFELRKLRDASTKADVGEAASEQQPPAALTAMSLMTGRIGPPSPTPAPSNQDQSVAATTTVGLLPELNSTIDSNPHALFRSLTSVGIQAARALAHAHAGGVVHRDIKPSNLLLDSAGNLWVTDFGLAKAEEDGLTQTGDIVGTLRYMAPERFHGWADPRSDVYSMGMTLYEMLTLRPAFATVDRARLVQQISEVGPPRPRTVDARIPHDLETIVLKAIEREPAHRYQSAEELADDLDRYLADEPIHARRSTPGERIWRWCRRNPLTASLLAGLALLLVVGTAVSLFAAVQFRNLAKREGESAAEARTERGKAVNAKKDTELANLEVTRQVIRLNVAAGLRAEADGDPFAALVSHGEALRLANSHNLSESLHRIRLGRLLRRLPTLQAVWSPRKTERVNPPRRFGSLFRLSPDGTRALSGSGLFGDGRPTELWETRTGRRLATPAPPGTRPMMTFFSRDSSLACVARRNGRVRVFKAADGKPLGPEVDHGSPATAALSQDSSRLITRGIPPDRSCRVWNPATGKLLLDFMKPGEEVEQIDLSPDGRFLVTKSPKARIRAWNLRTMTPVTPHMRMRTRSVHIAFHSDGEWIAACDRTKTAWARNLVARKPRRMTNDFDVRQIAFISDGSGILCVGSTKVALWDVGTGQRVAEVEHDAALSACFPNENGERLVLVERETPRSAYLVESGGGTKRRLPGRWLNEIQPPMPTAKGRRVIATVEKRSVYLMDLNKGEATHVLRHAHNVRGLQFADDGRTLITFDAERNAQLWDAELGVAVTPPLPHSTRVSQARYNAKQKTLTTIDAAETVHVWKIANGSRVERELRHQKPLNAVAWSPDGSTVLTASYDGTATLWNAATRKPVATLPHNAVVIDAVYSPNGEWIATADLPGRIHLWDAKTGRSRFHTPLRIGTQLKGLRFSADSTRLLTFGRSVRVWNVAADGLTLQTTIKVEANRAAFDATGRIVLVAGRRGTKSPAATLFDAETGKLRQVLHATEGRRVFTATEYSPDGRYILTATARYAEIFTKTKRREVYSERNPAAPRPGELFLWDAKTLREIARINFEVGIRSATFSRDGRFVVTASDDGTARVWASATGKPVTPLLQHNERLRHAAFGPKGRLVATAGDDNTARVWNAKTGESVAVFRHPSHVTRVRFSPDGLSLATACDDGTARLFNLRPDPRPASMLVRLSRLLSSRYVDKSGSIVPLDWKRLSKLSDVQQK